MAACYSVVLNPGHRRRSASITSEQAAGCRFRVRFNSSAKALLSLLARQISYGLASKALKLVETYAFATLGLRSLAADIGPDNSASLSLFLRASFQRQGLLRGNWRTHLGCATA